METIFSIPSTVMKKKQLVYKLNLRKYFLCIDSCKYICICVFLNICTHKYIYTHICRAGNKNQKVICNFSVLTEKLQIIF